MANWLVEFLRDPILQGIAAVILFFQVAFAIIGFLNPGWADRIRNALPLLIRNPIFTHAWFLFIGVVIGIAIASRNPASQVSEIYGTYEWQWAGENWYGRVTLAQQNGENVISDARVGIIEKVVLPNESDNIRMNGMLLNLNDGSFVIDNTGIKINLSVEKTDRRTNALETETISGSLQPVMCYAGTVYYGEEKKMGDMILVQHLSNVGTDVDDWFRDPNPPWYEYVSSQ